MPKTVTTIVEITVMPLYMCYRQVRMEKRKTYRILLSAVLIFMVSYSYSQDTIRLDKKVEYFSSSDTIGILDRHYFNVYTRAKHARELIKYSVTNYKLEYCFYYDNKRYVHDYDQFEYKISNNKISVKYGFLNEDWTYEKKNDTLFFLTRFSDEFYEKGLASSLIPLKKTGEFITYNNIGDTLWGTNYFKGYYPEVRSYNNIKDTIFELYQVDIPPKHEKITNISKIVIPTSSVNMPIWENYLDCSSVFLSAIINKKGYLQDIKLLRSCGEAYFEKTALEELAKLGHFSQGVKNGKDVNVKIICWIKFDNKN